MSRFADEKGQLKCSFCGKEQEQVKKLIAGPGVYICDECIELCNEIIEEEVSEDVDVELINTLSGRIGPSARWPSPCTTTISASTQI